MTDILSQDEINQLLDVISQSDTGGGGSGNKGGGVGSSGSLDYDLTTVQKKIKIYDFKRPDKFSKDQIRTVQMIHETFARLVSTLLSTKLRSVVEMHVASVDQLTYEEFLRSIPNPTTLCIINMDPLKGSAILEADPAITFSIIDRVFGGLGEPTKLSRELTDIEISVIESIIIQILGSLREAWSVVIDLTPRLGNIETNPQFAQIIPSNEMVILISFDTKIHLIEGVLNLCLPYITIQPIIQRLTAQYWFSPTSKVFSDFNEKILKHQIEDIIMNISIEIGDTNLKFKDLLTLQKGDIIKLGKTNVNDDFVMKVGGRPKFNCRPGKTGKHLAVQLGNSIKETSDDLLHSTRSYM